jgi:hypothetical protein
MRVERGQLSPRRFLIATIPEGRLHAEIEDDVEVELVDEFALKGFQRPVAAFNVLAVHEHLAELASAGI